jgi:hypothetical protein
VKNQFGQDVAVMYDTVSQRGNELQTVDFLER